MQTFTTIRPCTVQDAIATDKTLEGLFAQAEFWKEMAKAPHLPSDLKIEAKANSREAYDRAANHFYRNHK